MKFFALDLTQKEQYRDVLQACQTQTHVAHAQYKLPDGFGSIMGYWLTQSNEVVDGEFYEIALCETDTEAQELEGETVLIKSKPSDSLRITINAKQAVVVIKKACWERLSSALLLIITQYWRFANIDAQLHKLAFDARIMLPYASNPGPIETYKSSSCVKNNIAVQRLALDMPLYEAPLVDTKSYLNSSALISVYEDLVEQLHLEEWDEQLNNHLEAVTDAYADLTEKRFYYKSALSEFFMEFIIIAVLVLDLYFRMAD